MECRQCQGIETTFNDKIATKELMKYREKGPAKATHLLLNFLKNEGVEGMTLLDIGGGVGVIQHELVKTGVSKVISVDASSAYLSTSQKEAKHLGHFNRIVYYHGDFVDLAPNIPIADIVSLDRVICCYPDMDNLVERSVTHAKNYYGIIYPKDAWWMKIGMSLINMFQKLRRNKFRVFVHSRKKIHGIVQTNNFERCFSQNAGLWQVEIFKKSNI